MSHEYTILEKILKAIKNVKLEVILIGGAALSLQGVPIMTQDIDFFIRDTELNKKKIKELSKLLNASLYKKQHAISEVITIESKDFIIDFIFRLAPEQKFESIRSRAKKIKFGKYYCYVADLNDILKAKEFSDRPKDKLVIPLIKDTIDIKKKIQKR